MLYSPKCFNFALILLYIYLSCSPLLQNFGFILILCVGEISDFHRILRLIFHLILKGGGIQAYHFGKNNFKLGVEEEGQDMSRHFEGGFGSMGVILPM